MSLIECSGHVSLNLSTSGSVGYGEGYSVKIELDGMGELSLSEKWNLSNLDMTASSISVLDGDTEIKINYPGIKREHGVDKFSGYGKLKGDAKSLSSVSNLSLSLEVDENQLEVDKGFLLEAVGYKGGSPSVNLREYQTLESNFDILMGSSANAEDYEATIIFARNEFRRGQEGYIIQDVDGNTKAVDIREKLAEWEGLKEDLMDGAGQKKAFEVQQLMEKIRNGAEANLKVGNVTLHAEAGSDASYFKVTGKDGGVLEWEDNQITSTVNYINIVLSDDIRLGVEDLVLISSNKQAERESAWRVARETQEANKPNVLDFSDSTITKFQASIVVDWAETMENLQYSKNKEGLGVVQSGVRAVSIEVSHSTSAFFSLSSYVITDKEANKKLTISHSFDPDDFASDAAISVIDDSAIRMEGELTPSIIEQVKGVVVAHTKGLDKQIEIYPKSQSQVSVEESTPSKQTPKVFVAKSADRGGR
jgi:hypothetical protein